MERIGILTLMSALIFSLSLFGCRLDDNRIRGSINGGSLAPESIELSLKTFSDETSPLAQFSVPASQESSVSHFECKVDSSSWFTCTSPFDITTALSAGDVGTMYIRAVNTAGVATNAVSKSFRLGKIGRGFNNDVTKILNLPNGKTMVVGHFSAYQPTPSPFLVKLNADGTWDSTFNTGGAGAQYNNLVDGILQEIDATGNPVG